MAIFNVDSHEELWESLSTYPLSAIQKYEIHPLRDANFGFDKGIERIKKMMGS